MKRVVVTGALGHIGSRLIRELPAAFPGAEIVMVDDLSTQRYASLFNLPPSGRYRFIEADVLEANLGAILAGADAVVHLAAVTDAEASFRARGRVTKVNVEGARRVAEACLSAACPLVFPSTTSVYGSASAVVDEDCPEGELKPQSPYAESKLSAERMLTELGRARGLRFVTCRFGTIFGVSPGMRFHTAVNKFVWQACRGVPLTVWRAALDQRRPYLDLGDAVGAILFILRRGLFDGRIYNVLTANATVAEVLGHIRPHAPGLEIRHVDAPIMNQLSYEVSCAKFKSQGFEPVGGLPVGIAATFELLGGAGGR